MTSPIYADKSLTCRECGRAFTFTAGEQESFAQKGFTNEPGRCLDCRAARNARTSSVMGGRAYHSDRGYGVGYGRGAGDNGRPRREMFSAVCSECGRTAQVPFRPVPRKPVYCSSCFVPTRSRR